MNSYTFIKVMGPTLGKPLATLLVIPPGLSIAFNSQFDGLITKGVHLITVLDNSNNGLVKVFPVVYAPGGKEIELIHIPLGAGGTTSRKVLITHAIDPKNYIPTQTTYTYYDSFNHC